MHMARALETALSEISPRQGAEAAESMRTDIEKISKNAEIGLAVCDVVLGLAATGFGIHSFSRLLHGEKSIQNTIKNISREKSTDELSQQMNTRINRNLLKTGILTGFGGAVFAFRPVTRAADVLLTHTSASRHIGRIIFRICLKDMLPSKKSPVFIGQGKPGTI